MTRTSEELATQLRIAAEIGLQQMTEKQIALARHALGLPNKARKSYRNYFVTGPGTPDWDDWLAMVEAANATRRGPLEIFGGDSCFHLTRAGADVALRAGERLCGEDFADPLEQIEERGA